MIINIKATGLELTPALDIFVREKLANLAKKLGEHRDSTQAQVDIGMDSHHHKAGQIFRAEINLLYRGKQIRTEAENSDMYLAIDGAKDKMVREVIKYEKRQSSLFRRGGRAIKGIFRGWKR
ncbi:MAG: ribosomal subunit interface protein [Candidatus Vogelbacteria bacterium RIFOXYD2_FULL_44_9]|uniref:Ribosomal subunit interface protein n=1 Tax=Candidatus Vogelbacteria bacterium RIFOXYD2_FULL_44_9 TaxID=1802441 RepID=A0A1G2QQ86_9BACT|nr:MAG: ribosomal subunit interface protein [Candidatus Vogelbacteria bacterium RIFOXYD2_FULL_44_9]